MDQQFSLQTYSTDNNGQRTPLETTGPYANPAAALDAAAKLPQTPTTSQTYLTVSPAGGRPEREISLASEFREDDARGLLLRLMDYEKAHDRALQEIRDAKGHIRSFMYEPGSPNLAAAQRWYESMTRAQAEAKTLAEEFAGDPWYYVVVSNHPGAVPHESGDAPSGVGDGYQGHVGPFEHLRDATVRAQFTKAHADALLGPDGLQLLDRSTRYNLTRVQHRRTSEDMPEPQDPWDSHRLPRIPAISVVRWDAGDPEGAFLFEV